MYERQQLLEEEELGPAARRASSSLEIQICGLAGPLCALSLAAHAGLPELKAAIEAETGIPRSRQRLLHGTRELCADKGLEGLGATEVVTTLSLVQQKDPKQAQWLEELEASALDAASGWLRRAPTAAREDREVVLAAVARDGLALKFASRGLKADREVVLAAVGSEGQSLQFACPELRADRDVVLAAVDQEGLALQYAAPELKADFEVCVAAVASNKRSWGLVTKCFKTGRQFHREVMSRRVLHHGQPRAA